LSADVGTEQSLNIRDRSVVVLIHGWTNREANSPSAADSAFGGDWVGLRSALRNRLGRTGTKVVQFHWEQDASTGPAIMDLTEDDVPASSVLGWFLSWVQGGSDAVVAVGESLIFGSSGFANAASAAAAAYDNGARLACLVDTAAPDLRRITLVAHSAGSWAARRALTTLLDANPYLIGNLVLLDAFVPGVDDDFATAFTAPFMQALAADPNAERIHRLENYYAVDLTDLVRNRPGASSQTFHWSGRHIEQHVAYLNLSVLPGLGSELWAYGVRPDDLIGSGHRAPLRFYRDTVIADTAGHAVPNFLAQADWDYNDIGFSKGLEGQQLILPRILRQPTRATATDGSIVLTVDVRNPQLLTGLQWLHDGEPRSGATSPTLLLSNLSSNRGEYVVRLQNAHGVTFSEKLVLTLDSVSLASIQPITGSTAGGDPITITGTGFRAGATVKLGGVSASAVQVVSSTSITAVSGAHASGPTDVVVTNSDGTVATLANGFTFVTPVVDRPVVTTGSASAVTQTSAIVGASANPKGSATTLAVDYGVGSALTQSLAVGALGQGTTPVSRAVTLTNLACGTTYSYQARAVNTGGTSRGDVRQLTTESCPVPSSTELIRNGTFSSGAAHWALGGAFSADSRFSRCRSCEGYGYLSAANGDAANNLTGGVSQSVSIPTGVTAATLTFWFAIESADTGIAMRDTFVVTIRGPGGAVLATPASLSNMDRSAAYSQRSADMSAFAGQTVTIHFAGTTDAQLPAKFRLDDVSLLVRTDVIRPVATTTSASQMSQTTAVLAGTVVSAGSQASVWFDYGVSSAFGLSTPRQSVPASASAQTVTLEISGLTCGTTYSFRLVAEASASGSGSTLTFQTLPCASQGALRVSIEPQAAADLGAQWRISGEDQWRSSGSIAAVSLSTPYTVEFSGVTGWTTPPSKSVELQPAFADLWISSDLYRQIPIDPLWENFMNVAFGGGRFVVVGNSSNVVTTPDGVTWVRHSHSGGAYSGVSYLNGTFIAAGYSGGARLMTSADGTSWAQRFHSADMNSLQATAYGNGVYVAVGGGAFGQSIATSSDAMSWTPGVVPTRTPSIGNLTAVAFGNGVFVSTTEHGWALTSEDGRNWIIGDEAVAYNNYLTLKFGNGIFVAVGYGGRVLTSVDGRTWVLRQIGLAELFSDVAFAQDTFVAVGNAGALATSRDGAHWVLRSSGTTKHLRGIAFGGDQFVAAGFSGALIPVGANFANLIRVQPEDVEAVPTADVTFRVTAVGAGPFTYQWRRNGTALDGAVESDLILRGVAVDQSGSYSVVVASPAGTEISDDARLVVAVPQGQQRTPQLGWNQPAALPFGTPLSVAQLNATATVDGSPVQGTYSYDPGAGTVLAVGSGHTLHVTFTPADGALFTSASMTISVSVIGETTGAQVIASGLVGPGHLVLHDDDVWFRDNSASDGTIRRLAKQGGEIHTIVQGASLADAGVNRGVGTFAISGDYVVGDFGGYESHRVFRAPIAGGPLAILSAETGGQFVGIADERVFFGTDFFNLRSVDVQGSSAVHVHGGFWIRDAEVDNSGVHFVDYWTKDVLWYEFASGVVYPLIQGQETEGEIFGDAASIYLSVGGTIRRVARSGGPVTTIMTGAAVRGLASDGAFVYFTQGTALRRVPVAGGVAFTIAEGTSVTSLVADVTHLYYVDESGGSGAAAILKMSKEGLGPSVTAVSWTQPTAIVRGTPLSAVQLNATVAADGVPVEGTLTYAPPLGAVLAAGVGQQLNVTFVPADSGRYLPSAGSTSIDVLPTVPGPPRTVSVTAGVGSATVSWVAPESDGGAPVSRYDVTAAPGGGQCAATSGVLTCAVAGLAAGVAYTFIVTATNSAGTGPPSESSEAVGMPAVPGAPVALTATRGNGQVSVAFSAPSSNGGSAITSYTATASPCGATATGTTSPIVVTGLANGTPYSFTVVATNSVGTGAPSPASSSVTPATVSGAPTGVTGTRGNGQVSVAFSAPSSSGGSPITVYTATASPGGASATGGSSPLVVTGLTNGTAYTFSVTATNAVGSGPISAASTAVTPATVPSAPTGVVAIAGDGVALVSFSPPSNTGGIGIAGYVVTASPGGILRAGGASPVTVTGLTNGTAYTFTVAATNSVGTGLASSPSESVTPVASTPPSLTVAPSTLRFSAIKNGTAGPLVAVTGAQPIIVTVAGTPVGQWIATTSQPWLQVTGATGTGSGVFSVAIVNPLNVIGGATSLAGTISVVASNTGKSTTVAVELTIRQQTIGTQAPIGQVDTPIQASTGAQGAIAMTGWVVDDVGVSHVRVYRQCLGFDNPAACQTVLGARVVLVGEASVISGARPDVEGLYPTLPAANSAGWGFLILSNLLPNIPASSSSGVGVGTFTLYAVATDVEGHQKLLGRTVNDATPTTVTVANDVIEKPFGAIDTPGQGATVSGMLNNFGWALTPDPGTSVLIPTTGSTTTVFIDGASVGTATYNLCRGSVAVGGLAPAGVLCDDDVSSIFRTAGSFRNLDAARGAIGLRSIDTRTLTNGLHTISWGVTDSANRSEGIGSRYFNVLNSSADEVGRHDRGVQDHAALQGRLDRGVQGHAALLFARTGYDVLAAYSPLEANADGVPQARIPEHGRVELQIPGVADGALIVNGEARALPVGVGIDRERGIVTWVAGAGYLGTYRLSFSVQEPARRSLGAGGSSGPGVLVDVTVAPTATTDGPIRMQIDRVNRDGQVVTIHGWSLDPQAATGPGIGAVHFWGRRLVEGSEPVFLGVADLGVTRSDVAAAHGAQFPNAGFVFTGVLPAEGEWEVVAYVWVTRTGRFEDARTVTVR